MFALCKFHYEEHFNKAFIIFYYYYSAASSVSQAGLR